MRILHVNDIDSNDGGVGRYIDSVGDLLKSAGHASWLVHQRRSGLTDSVSMQSMEATVRISDGARIEEEVDQLLKRARPDVAYIHYVDDPALVEAVARRVPSVGYAHGFRQVCPGQAKLFHVGDTVCQRRAGAGCAPQIYLRRCCGARDPRSVMRVIKQTLRYRDVFQRLNSVIVSGGYMRGLLEQNGFDPMHIVELAPHFQSPLAAVPRSSEAETVLFSGRLEYEKGVPYLLRAMAVSRVGWRLDIAGDGTLRDEIRDLAVSLGISDRIRFLGWLDSDELQQAYERCSVVVMPSLMPEPFGKVGVEALASGRPVIAFDVGGIPDWLDDGVTGRLVAARDSLGLGAAIDQLVNDTELLRTMGKAGLEQVASRFSPEGHLRKLEGVLESALRSRAA